MRRHAPRPWVRLVAHGGDWPAVVELSSPGAENRLHTAYCALRAAGVQVVHTIVKNRGGWVQQHLSLLEANGAPLSRCRIREALVALKSNCGLTLVHGSSAIGGPHHTEGAS